MVEEARLEDVGGGLAPVGPGWFVVNAGEAPWVRSEAFGGRCVFESSPRVLAERPDVKPQRFTETGFTLAVVCNLVFRSTAATGTSSRRKRSSCSRGRVSSWSRSRSGRSTPGTSSTALPGRHTSSSARGTGRA